MKKMSRGLLLLVTLAPLLAVADVNVGDLPEDTIWYLHADLEAMRDGEAGSKLYAWFEDEVVDDVREEVGIDIGKEIESLTAFADLQDGTVIIANGPMAKDTQDKLLALAAQQGPVDPREYKGKTYYFFGDEDDPGESGGKFLEDLEDSVFVSFAVQGKALVTGTEAQMQALLDNKGKVSGPGSHDGALLVLTANKALVQAGMQTDALADEDDDDWDSNILRNTREVALLVADKSGQLAIEAQLQSTDPKMAQALGAIVNGLIGLQAFNSELEPGLQNLIRHTRVEVLENVLSISTLIDPNLVVTILDE